jgi:hypothetical protein
MRIIVAMLACCTALLAQSTPHIGAVVSAADFSPGIALGGFATIFGNNLSDVAHQAISTAYPTSLGPTQVALCLPGKIAAIQSDDCQYVPLVYASPTQINFLVPTAFAQFIPGVVIQVLEAGAVVVSVNGVLDDSATAGTNGGQNLGLYYPEPRIFFEGYDCFIDPWYQDAGKECGLTFTKGSTNRAYRGAITDQQWKLVTSSNPARFGQYYTLWMTGLGALTNSALSPYPLSWAALTNVPLYAAGGQLLPPEWNQTENINASYVGASSVYPGLYQINFQLLVPVNSQSPGPSGAGEPPSAFPCGAYDWEFGFEVNPLLGLAGLDVLNGGYPVQPDSAGFSIPIHVEPGDVPCGQ